MTVSFNCTCTAVLYGAVLIQQNVNLCARALNHLRFIQANLHIMHITLSLTLSLYTGTQL